MLMTQIVTITPVTNPIMSGIMFILPF